MRIALSPTAPGMSASQLVDLCVAAEEIGCRELWFAEVSGPESFSLMGAVARATSRADLGVAVVAAGNRSPALLSMGAGTVSQLLEGRALSLGIGSSSEFIMESWHGVPFEAPLATVGDTVRATRSLLAGERDYRGEVHDISRFPLASPPPGPVHLFVGALGPRMLRLAGAVGDGVCLNLMPPEAVVRQRAEVARGAADAGRTLDDGFTVMARLHVVPTEDLESGRGLIRQVFGPYFAQPVYNRFLAWLGYPSAAAAIVEAFAAGDRAGVGAALTNEIVDDVALVGPVDRIVDRLDEFAAAGVDVAALNIVAPGADGILDVLSKVLSP